MIFDLLEDNALLFDKPVQEHQLIKGLFFGDKIICEDVYKNNARNSVSIYKVC